MPFSSGKTLYFLPLQAERERAALWFPPWGQSGMTTDSLPLKAEVSLWPHKLPARPRPVRRPAPCPCLQSPGWLTDGLEIPYVVGDQTISRSWLAANQAGKPGLSAGCGVAWQDEPCSHRQVTCEGLEKRCPPHKDTRISEDKLKKKQEGFLYVSITVLRGVPSTRKEKPKYQVLQGSACLRSAAGSSRMCLSDSCFWR